MKIKFLRPVAGFAYFEGDVAELNDEKASSLVNKGWAIIVPDTEGEANQLPDDLPARDVLFDNGLETIDDVHNALETLTDLKGVGKKSAQKIKEYFNN